MWQDLSRLDFGAWKILEYYIYFEVCNFSHCIKKLQSQTLDRKPINNPIQGRCY